MHRCSIVLLQNIRSLISIFTPNLCFLLLSDPVTRFRACGKCKPLHVRSTRKYSGLVVFKTSTSL
jgi:hypothetical protein